jgi:hypothetical protein
MQAQQPGRRLARPASKLPQRSPSHLGAKLGWLLHARCRRPLALMLPNPVGHLVPFLAYLVPWQMVTWTATQNLKFTGALAHRKGWLARKTRPERGRKASRHRHIRLTAPASGSRSLTACSFPKSWGRASHSNHAHKQGGTPTAPGQAVCARAHSPAHYSAWQRHPAGSRRCSRSMVPVVGISCVSCNGSAQ